jgi:rhamnose transport system permease protein
MRRELSILAAFGAMLVALAVIAPAFFAPPNLRDIVLANVPVLLVAIGMTLVILLGQIDVSVGAQFALCAVAAGLFAKSGLRMEAVAIATMLAGAALGSVNAALVANLKLPSIVVTLASMAILRDAIRWATGGAWVQNLPGSFQWFGLGQVGGEFVIIGIAAAVFAAFAWGMRNLGAGRAVYATGSDMEAARLAGINTRAVMFSVFVLMGALTGLAAVLDSIRFSDIQSNAGVGLELKAIAAVVVGGTSINGGRGSLLGTLLGVAVLGAIGPALTFLGINAFWEQAIQGAIILWAVVMDAVVGQRLGSAPGRAKFLGV